jgi:hypothetical protein
VVRIPSYDIWAIVKWYEVYPHQQQHSNDTSSNGGAPGPPSMSKWILGGLKTTNNNSNSNSSSSSNTGSRTFAACIGSQEPSLYSVLTQRQHQQYNNSNKVWIFTSGSGPPLAGYEGTENVVPGIFSLLSGIAGTTANVVMEQARSSLFGRAVSRFSSAAAAAAGGGGGSGNKGKSTISKGKGNGGEQVIDADADDDDDETKRRKKAMLKDLLPPATTLSKPCTAFDDDDKRRITSVSISDCGTWASCCDSLGRILLVDTSSMVVVRVMKGYRDAQAVWMVGSSEEKKGEEKGGKEKLLLLAVYAPRRGVVEVWDAVNGVRMSSKQINSMHGLLVQEQSWFLDLDNLRILKLDGGGGGGGGERREM